MDLMKKKPLRAESAHPESTKDGGSARRESPLVDPKFAAAFQDKLRALLGKSGASQKQIAEMLGIGQNRVSQWVTSDPYAPRGWGEGPRIDHIVALADYFGVSLDYLCRWDASESPAVHRTPEEPAGDSAVRAVVESQGESEIRRLLYCAEAVSVDVALNRLYQRPENAPTEWVEAAEEWSPFNRTSVAAYPPLARFAGVHGMGRLSALLAPLTVLGVEESIRRIMSASTSADASQVRDLNSSWSRFGGPGGADPKKK